MSKGRKQFLAFFIPMVLAAAGLIVVIPQLFDGGTPELWGIAGALAVIAASCAGTAHRLRPAPGGSNAES